MPRTRRGRGDVPHVGSHDDIRAVLARPSPDRAQVVEDVLEVPPVRLHTAPGFETAVFSYITDIPFLSNWGTPLLLGPGSIHVAHTDHEHIAWTSWSRP